MDSSIREGEGKKEIPEIKTFAVSCNSEANQRNLNINTNIYSTYSKEQIINQAINFHLEGNFLEAAKYYQNLITQGFKDHIVFSNYGLILKNLGKLEEAESYQRKAISLKPDFANAHSNLGSLLIDLGKLQEAELSTRKAIKLNPGFANAYSNLGNILREIGNLKEAEVSTLKAIELNPNLADAHLNLGSIMIYLGKLQEAELSLRKAIKIKPDLTKAYYYLSLIKESDNNIWHNKLFSDSFLKNKLEKEQIDIYFARANIHHQKKDYKKSAKCLELANKIKIDPHKSQSDLFINKSKVLLLESNKKDLHQKKEAHYPQYIFIVGMPRSGSTLLESILSLNTSVCDLGEINILEESFIEQKEQKFTLVELYGKKVNNKTELNITTNKWLYNYQYAGIIARHIPNANIIHCYRDPLDNILSIYRAHFARGNDYASSLVDCTRVYLDQEEIMIQYKNRFRSKIYDLNYDLLVSNPNPEIKSLITWLGWEWDDTYLSPHLNPRSVSTASNVQVRSPINSKSLGGWKHYKNMLKPAIEILTQTDRYRDLIS